MENLYLVIKERGKQNVVVSIMFNKQDEKYHFVNITKGHICPCAFKTVEQAVQDMQEKKERGEIKNFVKIN